MRSGRVVGVLFFPLSMGGTTGFGSRWPQYANARVMGFFDALKAEWVDSIQSHSEPAIANQESRISHPDRQPSEANRSMACPARCTRKARPRDARRRARPRPRSVRGIVRQATRSTRLQSATIQGAEWPGSGGRTTDVRVTHIHFQFEPMYDILRIGLRPDSGEHNAGPAPLNLIGQAIHDDHTEKQRAGFGGLPSSNWNTSTIGSSPRRSVRYRTTRRTSPRCKSDPRRKRPSPTSRRSPASRPGMRRSSPRRIRPRASRSTRCRSRSPPC